MKHLRKNNGITLISLVITIIILLILVGITIAGLSENGLIYKALLAKEKTEVAQSDEENILSDYENKIDSYANGKVTIDKKDYDSLKNDLKLLTDRVSALESGFNSLGDTQKVSNTLTAKASESTEVCSLTLTKGKYIILGTAYDQSNKPNYVNLNVSGCNYATQSDASNENNVYSSWKMLNVSGFADIQENSKDVKLVAWSRNAFSISGSLIAIKLK